MSDNEVCSDDKFQICYIVGEYLCVFICPPPKKNKNFSVTAFDLGWILNVFQPENKSNMLYETSKHRRSAARRNKTEYR